LTRPAKQWHSAIFGKSVGHETRHRIGQPDRLTLDASAASGAAATAPNATMPFADKLLFTDAKLKAPPEFVRRSIPDAWRAVARMGRQANRWHETSAAFPPSQDEEARREFAAAAEHDVIETGQYDQA